jgi:hypothetical protein
MPYGGSSVAAGAVSFGGKSIVKTRSAKYAMASYILHMWISRAVEPRLERSAKTRPVSTEQVAEQFCAEMIQNLKRNVPETKHRLG